MQEGPDWTESWHVRIPTLAGLGAMLALLVPVLTRQKTLVADATRFPVFRLVFLAVTVGFVSQMIVGVSTLVVPLTPRTATLRPTLVLLNLGCLLRVSLQVASDWTPAAFRVIGVSGVLELLALLLWAAVLWRGLLGQVPRPVELPAGAPVAR